MSKKKPKVETIDARVARAVDGLDPSTFAGTMNTVDPKDATLAGIREKVLTVAAGDNGAFDERVLEVIQGGGKKNLTVEDIADTVDRGPAGVAASIQRLKARGFNVVAATGKRGGIQLDAIALPPVRSRIVHDAGEYQEGTWVRFGVCGDKHLCNMHARLDVMNLLYDFYAAEGITTVYDTGNWIDGECRFNKGELLVHGMSAQLKYWIENHPARPGITTKFVAGDDHEGWYQQRECVEIGKIAMLMARDAGRTDLEYLGYAEALVELKAAEGSRWMMVNHPGGGTAYATSYTGQKYVESLAGRREAEHRAAGALPQVQHRLPPRGLGGRYRNMLRPDAVHAEEEAAGARRGAARRSDAGAGRAHHPLPDGVPAVLRQGLLRGTAAAIWVGGVAAGSVSATLR